MADFEHPDWNVPERTQGYAKWEASLAHPFDSEERRIAAAAWDAAWIAHARFADGRKPMGKGSDDA